MPIQETRTIETDIWAAGNLYKPHMGRWSRKVAARFPARRIEATCASAFAKPCRSGKDDIGIALDARLGVRALLA